MTVPQRSSNHWRYRNTDNKEPHGAHPDRRAAWERIFFGMGPALLGGFLLGVGATWLFAEILRIIVDQQ